MSGIEIVSHTMGNIVVSDSRIPAPSLSEPPPLEPTIWATIVIFYTEKASLAIGGLGHGPYLVNPSFFFPFKVCHITKLLTKNFFINSFTNNYKKFYRVYFTLQQNQSIGNI